MSSKALPPLRFVGERGQHLWRATNLFICPLRLKNVAVRVCTYNIDLCVSPRWSSEDYFPLHLMGGFPVPVEVRKTTQRSEERRVGKEC